MWEERNVDSDVRPIFELCSNPDPNQVQWSCIIRDLNVYPRSPISCFLKSLTLISTMPFVKILEGEYLALTVRKASMR